MLEIEVKSQYITVKHVLSEPYLVSLEEWKMLCERKRVDTLSMSYENGSYTLCVEEEGQGNDQYSEIFISDPHFTACLKDVISYAEAKNLKFAEKTEESDYILTDEEDYSSIYTSPTGFEEGLRSDSAIF
jgi:hypothetical protein